MSRGYISRLPVPTAVPKQPPALPSLPSLATDDYVHPGTCNVSSNFSSRFRCCDPSPAFLVNGRPAYFAIGIVAWRLSASVVTISRVTSEPVVTPAGIVTFNW